MQQSPVRPSPNRYRRFWELAHGTVFLNHGSFGACPIPILDLQSELRKQMEAEPVQFLWRRYEERLEPARRAVAAFLDARADDLVFITNTTVGINAVARSFPLKAGDEVLTTSLDYNACHNVMALAVAERGASLVSAQVPFPIRSEDQIFEAVINSVTSRTRLAMLDHVTSNTGIILPIDRLIKELSRRGVEVVVDGAHAPGMLPLNLEDLKPAYYTGNLHKWVCAPKGAAFLWARKDLQANLQPAVISHGNNTPRPGYSPFQDRFDWAGTFDPSAWFCAGLTIDWMGKLLPGGWDELRARNHQLVIAARNLLCAALEVEAPCPESMLGSIAAIPAPDRFQGRPRTTKLDPEQMELYDKYGIEVPWNRMGDPVRRFFRISSQVYNSLEEYDYLAQAIRALA